MEYIIAVGFVSIVLYGFYKWMHEIDKYPIQEEKETLQEELKRLSRK